MLLPRSKIFRVKNYKKIFQAEKKKKKKKKKFNDNFDK